MRKVIMFMTIYSSLIFTTLSNMIILDNKSMIYAIYIFLIFIASISIMIFDYTKLNRIYTKDLFVFTIPLIMIILILISISKYKLNENTFDMVLQYITLCIPAYLMGFYIKKFHKQIYFFNMTFILNIFTTLVLFYSYLTTSIDYRGYFYNFGETSHLFIGYTSGIFLIYNILSLVSKSNQKMSSKKIEIGIKAIKLTLIVMQFWLIIGSGSRGALVAVVGTLTIYILVVRNIKKKNIFIFLCIILIAFIIGIEQDEIFRNGIINFTKVFFSDGNFIDLSASKNGRDVQYELALNLFKDNPLFGVGVLGYSSITNLPYPHNLFLELLSNYGLIITIPTVILLIISLKKNIKIFSYAPEHIYVLLIFIFNIIAMQLSYSLLTNSYFWFGFAYCLTNRHSAIYLPDSKEGYLNE